MRLEFSFPVGASERHPVNSACDQFWGRVTISADGKRIIRDWSDLLPFNIVKDYRFTVGDHEQHEVVDPLEQVS